MRQARQPPYVDRLGKPFSACRPRASNWAWPASASDRLPDENLASRREIGQTRREIYGFADRGIGAA